MEPPSGRLISLQWLGKRIANNLQEAIRLYNHLLLDQVSPPDFEKIEQANALVKSSVASVHQGARERNSICGVTP